MLHLHEAQGHACTSAGQRSNHSGTSLLFKLQCAVPGTDGRPGFATTAEQRLHFKTDWHRLNVKRRTAGHSPLSEDQFEAMLEGQHEASGSPDPHGVRLSDLW